MGLVGFNVTRFEHLRRLVAQRWGERDPDRVARLTDLLRQRYLVAFGDDAQAGDDYDDGAAPLAGGFLRRRSYSEIVGQASGRRRRAEGRRAVGRQQFLEYLDLQGKWAEIDLSRLTRIAVGTSDANQNELLFFGGETRPEDDPILVLAHGPRPGDPDDGPERRPPAIQLTRTEAYWWTTSGRITWSDGSGRPPPMRSDDPSAMPRGGLVS